MIVNGETLSDKTVREIEELWRDRMHEVSAIKVSQKSDLLIADESQIIYPKEMNRAQRRAYKKTFPRRFRLVEP
jgi:zona occludens toxin (predicted ATPase)